MSHGISVLIAYLNDEIQRSAVLPPRKAESEITREESLLGNREISLQVSTCKKPKRQMRQLIDRVQY